MKKVITYGTFDLFHQGHYNILKRAKEYGDYLIVGVTGENYDIGRGKLSVHDPLAVRIENVMATGFADEIIVEEYLGQKISDITKYNVDTFVIGDDWKGKFDHLARYCNLVYLERTKGVSSTQIRKEELDNYSIGIITDIPDDNSIVSEASKITSFEISGVYSEDQDVAEEFFEKYLSDDAEKDPDQGPILADSVGALAEASDIVYIRCHPEKRYQIAKAVLAEGKHVICDSPCALKKEQMEELYSIAEKNNVILMDNVKMVHIHVFNQLLWMTQGGLIGDILSIQCSISRNDRSRKNIFYDLLVQALCPSIKILGTDFDGLDIRMMKDSDGIEFASLDFEYGETRVVLSVGNKVRVRNQLEIIGSKGTIKIDGNWWRGNYFELDTPDIDNVEIYNTNYSGNGFKYLLKTMSTMLSNGRIDSTGLFRDESVKIVEIAEKVREMEEQ